MAILFLTNSELKGSTFRSRLINFSGRDTSSDVFSLLVKNNLGTVIKTIAPTVQGNAVLFQLTEIEALASSTYILEYWGEFSGLGKEMIVYETFTITKVPNDAQKNKNITLSATVEIEDVVINLAISNPVVQVIGEGGEGSGENGRSAYEIAVLNGFQGTEAEWLISLKGADGDDFTYEDFTPEQLALLKGADGKSAYQIALDNGFVGTQAEWLASLQGSGGGGTSPSTTFDTQNNTAAASMKATADYFLADYPELANVPIVIRGTGSYVSAVGNVITSANWRCTELIDVIEGDIYYYFGRTNIGSNGQAVVGYNSSDVFVSVILGAGVNASDGQAFTVPAGVSKIRSCSYMDTPLAIKNETFVKKLKTNLVPPVGVTPIPVSWGAIGHSIWSNDGTYTGFQTLVQQVYSFVSYSNYAYSGNSLTGSTTTDTTSILATAKTNTWQSKDIYTYDSITNDFKLNRPIGTQDDFLNNTGVTTYYGALRVLHEKLKSLNPNYFMIAANALKRNNADYTSWSLNSAGHTLTDYSNALEWVCNRLSWRFVNQFRDSGINDDNLGIFTYDGLHLNNLGYKRAGYLWINEFTLLSKTG